MSSESEKENKVLAELTELSGKIRFDLELLSNELKGKLTFSQNAMIQSIWERTMDLHYQLDRLKGESI